MHITLTTFETIGVSNPNQYPLSLRNHYSRSVYIKSFKITMPKYQGMPSPFDDTFEFDTIEMSPFVDVVAFDEVSISDN